MRIQFTKSWRQFRRGTVVDYADGAANVLVARTIAIAVPEVVAEVAATPFQQPKRKRGRPRKYPRPPE